MIKIFLFFFLHVIFVDSSLSFNGYLWLFFLIKKKAEQRSRNTFHIFIWTYIIHCVEKTMPPNFLLKRMCKNSTFLRWLLHKIQCEIKNEISKFLKNLTAFFSIHIKALQSSILLGLKNNIHRVASYLR